MKGHRIAAFGCPHPRSSVTGEGDLLVEEARLVADHGAGARWHSKQWHMDMRDRSRNVMVLWCFGFCAVGGVAIQFVS
jgi:hypothetical protein